MATSKIYFVSSNYVLYHIHEYSLLVIQCIVVIVQPYSKYQGWTNAKEGGILNKLLLEYLFILSKWMVK